MLTVVVTKAIQSNGFYFAFVDKLEKIVYNSQKLDTKDRNIK